MDACSATACAPTIFSVRLSVRCRLALLVADTGDPHVHVRLVVLLQLRQRIRDRNSAARHGLLDREECLWPADGRPSMVERGDRGRLDYMAI